MSTILKALRLVDDSRSTRPCFFPLRCNGQMLPNSFHSYYYRQCIYCSMNERYLYRIFLSLSSSTDIFVFYFLMLNAHSLSRSRHFTIRRYAVLPRGVEGMRILDNSHPFFRSHTPSPSSDLFDCRSPTRISLISLI